MHILQPNQKKLEEKEVERMLNKFNIGLTQLPKISLKDAGLPEGCKKGDVIEIKREDESYFRVVV